MTADRVTGPDQRGPILEAERVIAEMECDVAAYREIADVFLEELPAMRASIDAAQASQEVNRILSALHEIANSLGIVGATRGEFVIRGLEAELYEDPSCVELSVAASVARDCLDECVVALQAWVQAHTSGGA